MVVERELSGDRIAFEILGLARDAVKRGQIGDRARRMARPDAARLIAEKVVSLAR
jgi:UDP-N-acetylglucosamine:LPS N-acetylglucosamine transferase